MRSVAGRSPTISQGFRTVRSRSRVKSAEVPLAGLGSVVPGLGSVVPRLGGRTVRLGGQVPVIGDPVPLGLAISLCRDAGTISGIGAYAGRGEVTLGLAWLKGLTVRLGLANVIAHVDRILAMMSAGILDPSPLVSEHMSLEQAPEAYARYDRREALKIVLTP